MPTDTTPPVPVYAVVNADGTVTVVFDEALAVGGTGGTASLAIVVNGSAVDPTATSISTNTLTVTPMAGDEIDAGDANPSVGYAQQDARLQDAAGNEVAEFGITAVNNSALTATAATPPTAAEMVATIMAALAANPVGVVSVTVDGQSVQYSRQQALEELKFWKQQAALAAGTRPRAATIKLSGF